MNQVFKKPAIAQAILLSALFYQGALSLQLYQGSFLDKIYFKVDF